jgi:hypothetical protein
VSGPFERAFDYACRVDVEQVLPAWTRSEGELSAALLHAEVAMSRAYGRMLTLIADADERGLAASELDPETSAHYWSG